MSLRRKILAKDAFLLLAMLLMIGGVLWGLWRQHRHVQASLSEYAALQRVETAESRLAAYQQAVHAGQARDPQAIAELRAAESAMGEYKAVVSQYDTILPPEITPDLQFQVKARTRTLVAGLVRLTREVDPPMTAATQNGGESADVGSEVDALARELAELMAMCNGFVHRTQLASDHDLRSAIVAIAAGAGCIVAIAVAASFWQYRQVITPLNQLRAWCRQASAGDLLEPYEPTSDQEFQELARDVNKMAAELTAFHRRLEAMVAAKSGELVRSERLASVGYLAAGVAHEINSPLNIMSGYAELTLKRLHRLRLSPEQTADAAIADYMAIIRSEAFRCKDITQKLLSLAKGNGDIRQSVSLTQTMGDVSTMVRGLNSFRGKQLKVDIDADEPLCVYANPSEMKQVLLNLVINAIEAVSSGAGKVIITGRHSAGWVELEVADNGRGMTPDTLERAFEPFFTNKRGTSDSGTGLGLSITYAIVADHGGQITAHSDGPNCGSRFAVHLPASRVPMTVGAEGEPHPLTEAVL